MNRLRCSGPTWFNLSTSDIFLVGKGLNEWLSGALAMNV